MERPDALLDSSRFTEAIRDPVWKHVWLTPELRDLTASGPFTRLYRIKQLGPTELVYPGASHSRASHSIGVYHLALRLLRVLRERSGLSWTSPEGRASFLAAALLHDLGHFPFTHSLKELPLEAHESLTARAILEEPLRTLIAKTGADPHMAAAIIDESRDGSSEIVFFRSLLSGVLDPDKLDYLNRDAYYCGVPYGIQDTDFILSHVAAERARGIVIDSPAIMSVESVLFSKYLMYRSVYWHKNVRIATAMMKKALYSGLGAGTISPEELYAIDDNGVYELLERIGGDEATLAHAVRNRDIYLTLAEFPLASDANCPLCDLSLRAQAESRLATLFTERTGISVNAPDLVIDIPERISFESDLFVSDEAVPFHQSSTVFSGTIVTKFVSSLRKVRIALRPALAHAMDKDALSSDELAHYLGLRYN